MDWQTQLLPDLFTLGGTELRVWCWRPLESGLLHAAGLSTTSAWHGFWDRVLGCGCGISIAVESLAFCTHLIRRSAAALGWAIARCLAMIGGFLGVWAHAFCAVAGCSAGSYVWNRGCCCEVRANATTRLPFGSFLAVGGFVSAVIGETAVDWYLSLFAR